MTWMAGYSIKYLGCSSIVQIREEGGGEEGESNLYTMNLVKIGLCDSSKSCSSCGNGKAQYVVPMADFIDAYTESKMNAQEQACENVRENCYCDDVDDDEACEQQCYQSAGMSQCIQYEGEEEFQVQEYLDCGEMEAQDEDAIDYDSDGEAIPYYVGAYCANGYKINLAVFSDETCSTKVSSNKYSNANYGSSLPYTSESIVGKGCIACKEVDENADEDQDADEEENVEIAEICENSYEQAAKCEKGLKNVKSSVDTSGCTFISHVLPVMEHATTKISGKTKVVVSATATGFAIFFALTTAVFAAYSFFLFRKIHRAKVNLAAADGEMS